MNLVINSQFRPFTYDEMVKPLAQYKEVYDKIEQDYSTLASQAKMWENVVNKENSPKAYAMYKAYTNDLDNIVADFSRGMNLNNRRALMGMKARYASDIEPISVAAKRRELLSEEQRKAIANNPTMLYQRMASNMSIDDFIDNPSADYGQQYSGALITQQVANAASNLAKEARDSEQGRRLLRKILPYQYEMVQQSGFDHNAVMKAILNSPDADRILTGLVESAIETSGVKNWGDDETKRRAYDYARQGLYNAIGQTQYQMVTDQFGMQDALNARQHARQQASKEQPKRSRLNPIPLRNKEEVSYMYKKLQNYINLGYVKMDPKTGHLTVTNKGREIYFYNSKPQNVGELISGNQRSGMRVGAPVGGTQKSPKSINEFKQFIDEAGGGKYMGKSLDNAVWQPGMAGLHYQKYMDSYKDGAYDTYHTTEYERVLDESAGKDFMTALVSRGNLQPVTYKGKDKGYTNTGDRLQGDDLKDYRVGAIYTSKYGDVATLVGNGKKTIRVKLPADLSISNQTNANLAIKQADIYGEVLHKGYRPEFDSAGAIKLNSRGEVVYSKEKLTEEDRILLSRYQREALEDMSMYSSQYVVPSKTKTEEWEPINQ